MTRSLNRPVAGVVAFIALFWAFVLLVAFNAWRWLRA